MDRETKKQKGKRDRTHISGKNLLKNNKENNIHGDYVTKKSKAVGITKKKHFHRFSFYRHGENWILEQVEVSFQGEKDLIE